MLPRRPCLLAALALALAGCGLDTASPGVEAVAAHAGGAAETTPSVAAADGGPGGSVGNGTDGELATAGGVGVDQGRRAMPASIAVVGDSLTASAVEELEEELDGVGIEIVDVDGLPSRRMVTGTRTLTPGIDVVEEILERDSPELWVIALGTNDVASGVGTSTIRDDVGVILDLIPDDASVLWVNLWIRDFGDEVVEANAVIRRVVGRRANAAVVDWHSRAERPGIITGDGVHLTPAGQALFARSITDAIESMFLG